MQPAKDGVVIDDTGGLVIDDGLIAEIRFAVEQELDRFTFHIRVLLLGEVFGKTACRYDPIRSGVDVHIDDVGAAYFAGFLLLAEGQE